jgi:hypothetical protein
MNQLANGFADRGHLVRLSAKREPLERTAYAGGQDVRDPSRYGSWINLRRFEVLGDNEAVRAAPPAKQFPKAYGMVS